MKSLFEFKNHQELIRQSIDLHPNINQKTLAEHLKVQKTYISNALSGRQNFTPEQCLLISKVFALSSKEAKVLLLLNNRDRAGSHDLEQFYQEELSRLKKKEETIRSRIKSEKQLDQDQVYQYCESIYHSLIYTALRVPELQTLEAISKNFGISLLQTLASLNTLNDLGLAHKNENNRWLPTSKRIHISQKGLALKSYLKNFRQLSMSAIDDLKEDSLHYSLAFATDQETRKKIRNLILDLIQKSEPLIEKSNEENVIVFCADFFEVSKT
jgi:uncharacterized protein (TIGR02147 family)